MKKTIALFLLPAFLFYNCSAQNEVSLKVRYKPESSYTQKNEQISEIKLTYSGPKDFLKTMADKGVANPMVKKQTTTNQLVFKTGKLTAEHTFPLTVKFLKSTSSDEQSPIPDGTIIYGHAETGAMPKLDSIASNDLDEKFKEKVLTAAQSLIDQINYPDKPVKVGGKISVETPVSLPIGGTTMEMGITTTYKLLNVTNGIANFDISQVYTFKSASGSYTLKGTGQGKGQLQYATANNFVRRYQLDMSMKLHMKMENFSMDMEQSTGLLQTSVFAAN